MRRECSEERSKEGGEVRKTVVGGARGGRSGGVQWRERRGGEGRESGM